MEVEVMNNGKKVKKLRVTGFELRVFLTGTRDTEPEIASNSPTQTIKIPVESVKIRRKSLVYKGLILQTESGSIQASVLEHASDRRGGFFSLTPWIPRCIIS